MQAVESCAHATGNSGNVVVWGAPHLTERVDPSGLEFLVSPLSFRQINPRQGQALVRLVADAAGAPLSPSQPHHACALHAWTLKASLLPSGGPAAGNLCRVPVRCQSKLRAPWSFQHGTRGLCCCASAKRMQAPWLCRG